jgi:hypothetical protein
MDNKSIIVTDIMRLKSILQYRQYYEKMLIDFINNKQMETILKISNNLPNNLLNSIISLKNDKKKDTCEILKFLDNKLQDICEHEWEIDDIDFMDNGQEETCKIKYCKKCELQLNID